MRKRPKISQNATQGKPFEGALNDFGSALCGHFEHNFGLKIKSTYPKLAESLQHTVGGFCLRVILQEFAAANSLSLPRNRSSYNRLVNSLYSDEWGDYLFSQYPELNRLAHSVQDRLNYTKHVVEKFYRISERDAEFLGIKKSAAVLDAQPQGDVHSQGSSTLRLTFEDGTHLYYKPSHVGNIFLVQRLLEMINPHLKAPLYSPRTVGTDSAHWQEEVISSQDTTAPDRYYQYGAWMALSDALSLIDLHMENVLETKSGPVIIDFECFPSTDYKNRNLRSPLPKIARSGLLPAPFTFVANAPLVDWSALAGVIDGTPESWAMHFIKDDGLPTVHLTEQAHQTTTERLNSQGKLVPSPCNELSLKTGYADAQHALSVIGWPKVRSLADLYQPEVRIVVRATQIYQNCLRRSSYPEYLRNPESRKATLRSWLSPESIDSEILEKEVSELCNFSIPAFHVSANSTSLGGAEIFKPIEMLEISFAEATSSLRTRQVDRYVRQIFEVRQENPVVMPPVLHNAKIKNRPDRREKLEIIYSVVDSICALGHSSSLGPTWINAQKDQDGTWVQNGYSPYLYSGVAGTYLALSEAALHVNHPPKIRRPLEHLLNNLRFHLKKCLSVPDQMLSTGLFEGVGGILYALSLDASSSELEEITTAFYKLAEERLEHLGYDLISGTSGVLILASRLAKMEILPAQTRQLQLACLQHLTRNSKLDSNGLRLWDKDEDWIGGLSHGPAGVAWAVRETAFAHEYAFLGEDAWRTQYSLLNPDGTSWRNRNLSQETPLCAWCHGTEGIALMLHLTARECPDSSSQSVALRNAPLPSEPSLCHGLAGRYLSLHELGHKKEADTAAIKLWHYAKRNLHEITALDDSLMTGRAGILLALLHDYTCGATINPLKIQFRG